MSRLKPLISIVVALASVTIGQVAKAECSSQGCSGLIDELYIESNGGLYVKTAGNELLANCVPNSNVYLYLPASASRFKEVYAMLLTAYAMDRPVWIRVNEGSNPCTIAYVVVPRQ